MIFSIMNDCYSPSLSLIICTYQRPRQLDISLSKYSKLNNISECEIIVVLNGSDCEESFEVVSQYIIKIPQIRIVKEKNIGLSIARNAGLKSARANFVFYIDDDAYPSEHLITRLLKLKNDGILCISGRTIFWKIDEPNWVEPRYVEVPKFRERFGIMPKQGYLNGCACGFSKDLLINVDGFSKRYGMTGKAIAYHEEVHIQSKIEKLGISVYYDPDLLVYHRSHFITVKGFLVSAFKKGFYYARYEKPNRFHTVLSLLYYSTKYSPKFIFSCLTMKWQTAFLDFLMPISNKIGQLLYKK